MWNLYKSQSDYRKFAIRAIVFGFVWYVFFYFIRQQETVVPYYDVLIESLTASLLHASQTVLGWIGEDSLVYYKSIQQIGGSGIYLDKGCLGRNLMGLYAGFLIVFPGRTDSKLWFISLGLIGIVCLNILRIVALYLTLKYWPQYLDINHHVVFKYTVYTFTFVLWYWWIKRYRLPHSSAK
ncbi:MAG: hypothetical protein RIS47_2259 [Bacteroidota bacterium]|jgi:exosortase/archaeosortase family protein